MLALYLVGFVVGGALLLISTLSGQGDADVDADADADADADGDAGEHGLDPDAVSAAASWLPVSSIRFWVFFAAFFGLTGVAFTALGLASVPVTLAVSIGMGWLTGATASWVVRRLRRATVSSALEARDWQGAPGTVVLPVEPGGVGKVRLELRGRTVDATAVTEEGMRLGAGDEVLVYGVRDDGVIEVVLSRNVAADDERRQS
jgi:hypothetical protein